MTRAQIRNQIREQARLWNYGRGFWYDWTIHRNDETIVGSGARRLYKMAQEGDRIHLNVNVRKPGRGCAGYNIRNYTINLPSE